jgi:hypothetical protein
MKPLNLTAHAPRKPSERLAGVIFMARTVDKMRASLPGGDLGAYKVDGFSTRMLGYLGITEAELAAVVASADSEAAVEAYILERTSQATRDECNAKLLERNVGDYIANMQGFLTRYPFAETLPPETTIIEMLALDDAHLFARQ